MGFGSYDESEQRAPAVTTGERDEEDDDLHKNDYEGTVSFESGASTDDLVSRLAGIKEDATEE